MSGALSGEEMEITAELYALLLAVRQDRYLAVKFPPTLLKRVDAALARTEKQLERARA